MLKIDLEGIIRTADIRPALPKELKESGNNAELAPAILYGQEIDLLVRHCRLYMALILDDILREKSIQDICQKFRTTRGEIQALQVAAQNNAGMVAAFCGRLYWSDLSLLFQRVSDRLALAVSEELLDLTQLPSLKAQRARMLAKHGILSIADLLARCKHTADLAEIFMKEERFESKRITNKSERLAM